MKFGPAKRQRGAAVGDGRKPEHRPRGKADQRGAADDGRDQGARTERHSRHRDQHDADDADGDRDQRAWRDALAQEDEAEKCGLRRLGARIGGADREVAEREEVDQQEGRGDLADPAQRHPKKERGIDRRQRIGRAEMQHGDDQDGDRAAEAEPHEGRAVRAHDALEVLLQRRPQVLQEGGGNGDRYPEFHGRFQADAARFQLACDLSGQTCQGRAACGPSGTDAMRQVRVASQIVWRAPRLPLARVATSSTRKPDRREPRAERPVGMR